MTKAIRIIEVGPRDGLQNEPSLQNLPMLVEKRTNFITKLAACGLQDIEVGAFVRPDRIPQMVGTDEILKNLQKNKTLWETKRFWCLVPNQKGLDNALKAGAKHVSIFTATSESFNQKNIQMSIETSLKEIKQIVQTASQNKLKVRGYISTVWGCPYSGTTSLQKAFDITRQLLDMGVEEISLGDTIGVATPNQVSALLKLFPKDLPLAMHFHDTRGTALANTLRSLEHGIKIIDSSAGGLGGCPYAKGASGNLATEDLLYMLSDMDTGVDLHKLCLAVEEFAQKTALRLPSRYYSAWKAQRKGKTSH